MLHCELEIWDGVHITPLLHTPFDQHRHTRTVHCPVFISFQRFWAMKMSLCSFTIQLQVSLKLLTQALPSTKKKKKKTSGSRNEAAHHDRHASIGFGSKKDARNMNAWMWVQKCATFNKMNKLHPDPGHKLWTWSTSGGELPEHLGQFSLQQSHQHWESNTSRDQVQQSRLGKNKTQPL